MCSGCGAVQATQSFPTLPTARIGLPRGSRHVVVVPSPLPRPTPTATSLPTIAAPTATITPAPVVTSIPAIVDTASDPAAGEATLAQLINQTRAEHGLPPYEIVAELGVAARAHSCDLAANALISHLSSTGQTLTQRLQGSRTAWQWPSENIAAGSDDPTVILHVWMDEPPDGPHLLNILSADQQAVGVGYCFRADDPTGNHHYWTADFARH